MRPLLAVVSAAAAGQGEARAAVRACLLRSLWGNQADLSLSAGAVCHPSSSGGTVLCDQSELALDLLLGAKGRTVAVVLDNHGIEVLSDLVLVDALLRVAGVGTVVLHVKDVPGILGWVEEHDPEFGGRLRGHVAAGRLRVLPHEFYTSARAFWQLPAPLERELAQSAVALLKGDANFRRLLGDRHWPYDTHFGEHAKSFWPSPGLVSLRTMKSGVAIGIPKEAQERAKRASPSDWLTSGCYGQILASG